MHEMAGLLGDLEFPEKARLKSLARHAQIGLWDPALQVSTLPIRSDAVSYQIQFISYTKSYPVLR